MTRPPGADELRPQLMSHQVLTTAPATFVDHEMQVRFDEANLSARISAAGRLTEALTVDVLAIDEGERAANGPEPELTVAAVHGFTPNSVDALAILRRSLEAAAGVDSDAWLLASESAIEVDRSAEAGRLDPLRPGYLFGRLNEGWQVVVRNPGGLGRPLQNVIDDLALTTGAEALLHFGIRGALGPVPKQLAHRQLVIQIAGRSGVVVHNADGQKQTRLHPGQVLVVAADHQLSHLPLDEDTLFLVMPLITDGLDDQDRAVRSMMAARSTMSYHAARKAIDSDPAIGWAFRMVAPGGVHVVGVGDTAVELAVGGLEIVVSTVGAHVLVELANGEYRTGGELAAALHCDAAAVVAFCEELWGLGLLDPAMPAVVPQGGGERLTQVASTPDGEGAAVEPLLACVDDDAWRPPATGEVHHGVNVDVAVQALSFEEHRDALAAPLAMALEMNTQFFGVDVAKAMAADPPLLVRVRPGLEVAEPRDALGSDLVAFPNRKLTFVVALSEADGGWIHLPAGSPARQSTTGSVCAWPAIRPWEIASIAAGERLFLLGRLHGPRFR